MEGSNVESSLNSQESAEAWQCLYMRYDSQLVPLLKAGHQVAYGFDDSANMDKNRKLLLVTGDSDDELKLRMVSSPRASRPSSLLSTLLLSSSKDLSKGRHLSIDYDRDGRSSNSCNHNSPSRLSPDSPGCNRTSIDELTGQACLILRTCTSESSLGGETQFSSSPPIPIPTTTYLRDPRQIEERARLQQARVLYRIQLDVEKANRATDAGINM